MNISIKDVLQRIRPFFILYLILLICCLVLKLIYTKEEIYFAVNSRTNAPGDVVAPYITNMGNGWTIVTLSALLLLYNYRLAFLMATTYTITSLSAQLVKYIFDAPRPKLYFKDQISKLHFAKGVEILSYHSFPLGHTVSAFSTGILIAYLVKNKSWDVLIFALAVLIGFSRMYLSQHFFEDVVAGSVLGVFLTIFWISYIDSKQFLHTARWNKGLLNPME